MATARDDNTTMMTLAMTMMTRKRGVLVKIRKKFIWMMFINNQMSLDIFATLPKVDP